MICFHKQSNKSDRRKYKKNKDLKRDTKQISFGEKPGPCYITRAIFLEKSKDAI